ncbi:NAD(P)-dependent oxidoreductase [Nocardioides halotolerans]|uniref:NAD(P)-dependent oxidoreductase n=1 Tax=Nocardioides halotolerans TaxID=433660 RepID=UPI000409B6C6|nr:NAD(P)-dependent oxidoreductase [Nocardioides halotolerans]
MSDRPVVAVLDVMPEASRAVISQVFGSDFDVVFADGDRPEDKQALAAGATALLTMWGAVDADTIAAAGSCRVIQKLGIGTDKIDDAAARARGIAVLKAAGINAEAVAELAVLLALAVGRQLPRATAAAREGLAVKEELRAVSFQLMGRTVGLVGFGHIGRAAASRFRAFGAEIVYFDPYRPDAGVEAALGARYLELVELLATADVVSLHVPAADRPVLDARTLGLLKAGAIVVNTARGSLIDEPALVEAVRSGRLLGAGLDVTTVEPLPTDSPLRDLEQVVLTPHVGGAVANNFPRVIQRAFDNVQAVLDGRAVAPADVVVPAPEPVR